VTLSFRVFEQRKENGQWSIQECASFRSEFDAISYAQRAAQVWLSSDASVRVLLVRDGEAVQQLAVNCERLALADAREAIRAAQKPEKADWRERMGESKGAVLGG